MNDRNEMFGSTTWIKISEDIVQQCVAFAEAMKDKHDPNSHRTKFRRSPEQIRLNAYQGKLAEWAVYLEAEKLGFTVSKPDMKVSELGEWDDGDIFVEGIHVGVKAVKGYAGCLLLTQKDFLSDGTLSYGTTPQSTPRLHTLVRIQHSSSEQRLDLCPQYQIVGWVTHKQFWRDKRELVAGSRINGKTLFAFFQKHEALPHVENDHDPERLLADNYGMHGLDLWPWTKFSLIIRRILDSLVA